jgi:isoamylase
MRQERLLFHLILNAYGEPLDFELLSVDKGGDNPWWRWIDMALDSPHNIVSWQIPLKCYGSLLGGCSPIAAH